MIYPFFTPENEFDLWILIHLGAISLPKASSLLYELSNPILEDEERISIDVAVSSLDEMKSQISSRLYTASGYRNYWLGYKTALEGFLIGYAAFVYVNPSEHPFPALMVKAMIEALKATRIAYRNTPLRPFVQMNSMTLMEDLGFPVKDI